MTNAKLKRTSGILMALTVLSFGVLNIVSCDETTKVVTVKESGLLAEALTPSANSGQSLFPTSYLDFDFSGLPQEVGLVEIKYFGVMQGGGTVDAILNPKIHIVQGDTTVGAHVWESYFGFAHALQGTSFGLMFRVSDSLVVDLNQIPQANFDKTQPFIVRLISTNGHGWFLNAPGADHQAFIYDLTIE